MDDDFFNLPDANVTGWFEDDVLIAEMDADDYVRYFTNKKYNIMRSDGSADNFF